MTVMPERRHYFAIFFISLSLLMMEITIARMLTVALFSHYAFVAISLAMFGLGLSGLVIYLLPSHFPAARVDEQLTTFAALFGLSAAVCVLLFLRVQVVQELSLRGLATLGLAYAILAVPFFLGGLCVSLLMTHFSARIASIYFADLVGASLGCLGVVTALGLAPAPQVVTVIALVVSAGTAVVALAGGGRTTLALASTAIVAALVVLGFTTDLYQMRYIKQRTSTYSEYEVWNAFSRISAFDFDGKNAAEIVPMKEPAQTYKGGDYPPTKMLDIDGAAWTPMMGWDGDPASVQFLRDSVLYAVHELRPNAKVLIIGTGGGRDLLAAAATYGQPSVLGIEINPSMRHVVEERYADYTGHPYMLPNVEVIIDEARSRLSSVDRQFDIIQLSLIDTFSLNAAGGFVFSENYLYTVEGFQEYFQHLGDDGVLSLTRYFVPVYPLEILRLIAMARAALEAEGVTTDFASHLVILLQGVNASMMVKKTPFTPAELATLQAKAVALKAQVLFGPWAPGEGHADVTKLVQTANWREWVASYPYYIHPPTDDRPFFFNFLRGLVRGNVDDPFHFIKMWNDALVLMYMLIAVVTAIATTFFFAPLLTFGRRPHRVPATIAAPLLLYFACLGYGFLMIEIPLLQRFVLFLGYPVYALAVVLFALLLFSGIGSLASSRFDGDARRSLLNVLGAIVILALLYLAVVPVVIDAFLGTPILVRIGITVALLAPIGLLLGMAYPLGITVLRGFGEELVPWAWALNGVMSVFASVVSTFIGSRIGFSAAFVTGVTAYAVGFAAITLATRGTGSPSR